MVLTRGLTKIEKELVKLIDTSKQTLHDCPKHGLYLLRIGKTNDKCPRCNSSNEIVENVAELKASIED